MDTHEHPFRKWSLKCRLISSFKFWCIVCRVEEWTMAFFQFPWSMLVCLPLEKKINFFLRQRISCLTLYHNCSQLYFHIPCIVRLAKYVLWKWTASYENSVTPFMECSLCLWTTLPKKWKKKSEKQKQKKVRN